MLSPFEVLKKYWNYESFLEPQEKIINSVLDKNNTVAILPTGGGKSICYQVPALIKEGVCLVISPLIALMTDQITNLKDRGIKAVAITSALNQEDVIKAFDNLQYGKFKFLYLSPEKLRSDFIQQKIKQLKINLIAVDEAHCISEWGHDFRPSYLKIPIVKELTPNTPIMALTATATSRVVKDIIENLDIEGATVVKESLSRKNLSLRILQNEDIYYHLKKILKSLNHPAILYANSRKKVKTISDYLNKNNFKSTFYHGGLSPHEKQVSFNSWMEEKLPIMVATNAFGMGIDKSNVACIIHIDLPFSLENYMQEAGRAGRDGNLAYSYIFSNENTITDLEKRFKRGLVTVDFARSIYNNLNSYLHISYGELPDRIFDFDLSDFCMRYKTAILPTYNALKLLEREEVIIFDESLNKRSSLEFIAPPDAVLQYADSHNSQLIKTILRSYGGIFEQPINIDESVLASKLNLTKEEVKKQLLVLKKDNLATYTYQKNISGVRFLAPREDKYTIHKISPYLLRQNKIKSDKINAVVQYAKNDAVCRMRFLLNYFDERSVENCGICDVCSKTNVTNERTDKYELSEKIMELFLTNKQLSTKEILSALPFDTENIIRVLQLLLDTNKITINSHNKLEKIKK